MNERLMSPERQDELVKIAVECIGLMNIGVEGSKALAKLADDKVLTDHEVDRVAEAVNNSKQLAHLQQSDPDDREKTFPLINAADAKDMRDQPATNAEVNTGDRYGRQEELADSTAEKQEEPDSNDIKADMQKAASTSYSDTGSYFSSPDTPDYAAMFKAACAVDGSALPTYDDPNAAWRDLDEYRVVLEETRVKYASAYGQCLAGLDSLANDLHRLDAPEFERVEAAAKLAGVTPGILDLVYEHAGLNVKRASDTAERMHISSDENSYVQRIMDVDGHMQEAAVVKNAQDYFEAEYADKLAKLAKLAKDEGGGDLGLWGSKMDVDAKDIADELEKAPGALAPSEDVQEAIAPAGESTPPRSPMDILSPADSSEMAEVDARSRLQGLMANDDYIGGHNIAEVVDAYNAAMSVNPQFGDAELTSYVRQHLGSSGSVPLDIQVRARASKGLGDDE